MAVALAPLTRTASGSTSTSSQPSSTTLDRINFQAQVQSCVMEADYRMLSLIRFSPCTASEHEGTFA